MATRTLRVTRRQALALAAGTDFSRTVVSVAGWATLGMLVMLALPRAVGGRMEG